MKRYVTLFVVQLQLDRVKIKITLFPVGTAVCVQLEYCTLKFPVVLTFILRTSMYYYTTRL